MYGICSRNRWFFCGHGDTTRDRDAVLLGIKNKYDRIDISDERPELLLALISRNTNHDKNNWQDEMESIKTILGNAIDKYGEMLNDVYVAGASEIGVGLYADKKMKLEILYDILSGRV